MCRGRAWIVACGGMTSAISRTCCPRRLLKPRKTFKTYEPGFLHVDVKYLPQMADETTRRYLFVAIDRATRWVFVRFMPAKTAANARRLPHAICTGPARSRLPRY